jgi:hypothetical protein
MNAHIQNLPLCLLETRGVTMIHIESSHDAISATRIGIIDIVEFLLQNEAALCVHNFMFFHDISVTFFFFMES